MFFKNVRRVSNIALGKQLWSAHGLTLGKAAFAESFFTEWATPSATLGEHFAECFWAFAECPWQSASSGFPVVNPSYIF
jgi:hypothetical protein